MQNRIGWFFASFFGCLVGLVLTLGGASNIKDVDVAVLPPQPIVRPPEPPVKPIEPPAPRPQVEPDLIGVQVPIPKDCRVFNKSGSQCVWCSIECLARYHKVTDLYEGDRRITKHYTWATGPAEVYLVLNARYPNVGWAQLSNRNEVKSFLKKYVTEKKLGVGFSVPGHMLNMIHYDETNRIVKVIDNIGPQALEVQEWSMEKFENLSQGWALTIFPPGYKVSASDYGEIVTSYDGLLCHGNLRSGLLDFGDNWRWLSIR